MNDREKQIVRIVNKMIHRHVFQMPVDIQQLCEAYGAHWLTFGQLGPETAIGLIGNRDGAAIDLDRNTWGILYNEKVPETRLRFTLAEELMHRLLSHSQDPDFVFYRQTYTEEKYGQYEAEAKRAAGMILVPPTLYYKYRQVYCHDQIAKLCHVSEACVYTVAKFYEEHEEEIRVAFTGETILCDTRGLKRKYPLRPRAVVGESL